MAQINMLGATVIQLVGHLSVNPRVGGLTPVLPDSCYCFLIIKRLTLPAWYILNSTTILQSRQGDVPKKTGRKPDYFLCRSF